MYGQSLNYSQYERMQHDSTARTNNRSDPSRNCTATPKHPSYPSGSANADRSASLSKAREAYEEAIRASAELRRVLDTGDETLRTLMSEIEDTVNVHVVKSTPDKKRPEPAKIESIKAEERSPQVVNELP